MASILWQGTGQAAHLLSACVQQVRNTLCTTRHCLRSMFLEHVSGRRYWSRLATKGAAKSDGGRRGGHASQGLSSAKQNVPAGALGTCRRLVLTGARLTVWDEGCLTSDLAAPVGDSLFREQLDVLRGSQPRNTPEACSLSAANC